MRTVVVVGNPKPASRTLAAAVTTAGLLSGGDADQVVDQVIDVATLGPGLLGWGDETVRRAVADAASADLLVVASPTFKATYSGLLKLFLDQFAGGEGLRGVTAVPLMLGAAPTHALAPELLLKPVLSELGAAVPAPGLYLIDKDAEAHGASTPALVAYVERWGATLRATAAARQDTLAATRSAV
ncbi:NADPH-dependent FMN reductase [Kineococcus aurantiacus]|uniref:FMN reductase n=1 Tax=Kineococcus aurantiacus TaxID=37633 RepID=A0A7Y9DM37_9ACTN|nr:NAD(P)H-dependent oxidoreductase [Kineococcus aurantiacus]NYD23026.1 FMN reductase [Kineococcus aurantiacus]